MQNKHHKKISLHPNTLVVSALVLFLFVLLGFIVSYSTFLFESKRGLVACTEEARLCPNGSSVSRSGPYCEFTPCPTDDLPTRPGITEEPLEVPLAPQPKKLPREEVFCTQEVKTCPDGSFVGKAGPECEFAPCPDDLELDSDR